MSPTTEPWPERVGEQERKSLDKVFWRWALGPDGQDVQRGLWDEAIAWERQKAAPKGGLRTDGQSWLDKLRYG